MHKTRRRISVTVLRVGLFLSIASCIAFYLGVGTTVQAASVGKQGIGAKSSIYTKSDVLVSGIKVRKGIFVGEADSHTVAIKSAGYEWCYQTYESPQLSIDKFKSGDKVTIQYKEVKYANGVSVLKLIKITKIVNN